MPSIESLNQAHAIGTLLTFREGPGGFPMIDISTANAEARVSLYGGQLLSYRPAGAGEDLLFVSDAAYYEDGKAIKGGVPVCWPWFGDDPDGLGRPAHGFVRNRLWNMVSSAELPGGDVLVVMTTGVIGGGSTDWPHSAILTLEITVGKALQLTLQTENIGDSTFTLSQALHTYFRIGDIQRVSVQGLEDRYYRDKADQWAEKQQQGPVTIDDEVDRVYLDVQPELLIDDPGLDRKIRIDSTGSRTAVVWNPWRTVAKAMADLEDDDYQHFICVETTNTANDCIDLPSGSQHRLSVRYRLC